MKHGQQHDRHHENSFLGQRLDEPAAEGEDHKGRHTVNQQQQH
jgi:hypothetical protein